MIREGDTPKDKTRSISAMEAQSKLAPNSCNRLIKPVSGLHLIA